jgi:very-short-patch-repair endonuclease
VDQRVAELAGEDWGVLSTRELIDCGLSDKEIAGRRRSGRLHRLFRGVYAVGHPNPPWEGRLLAAVKACGPSALLSHWSAAELWRFVDRLDGLPHVTVIGRGSRRHHGINLHTTTCLDPIDRRELDRIPVTSAARTLLDLASMLDQLRTRRAVRRALGTGKVTVRQIGLVLDRYAGARGCKVLRYAVASGAEPTRSEAESDVLDVVHEAGFARPDVNRPLLLDGRRLVPDLRWPAERLILEIDSTAWHTDPLARADDRERQAFLEAHGETVLRIHWRDAVLRLRAFAAMLDDAGVRRG